ncbi:MAG TPA: thiamine pyrophosphate-dependent enzyme, partial [Ilumatobacteraceae bacterium]|nr:thiamine pyrophosphate-dependent enzyme [Ilumatobacteraceae bacterium]
IPEPLARPGESPRFAELALSPAGAVRRPEVDAGEDSLLDLASSLVRVLDDDGEAVGPWSGRLSADDLVAGAHDMLRTRAFDAKMLRAQRQGKTSFYVQCLGEEAISCGQARELSRGDM